MRSAYIPNDHRFRAIRNRLTAKFFIHSIHLCLLLFAQTNVLAGQQGLAAECNIGRGADTSRVAQAHTRDVFGEAGRTRHAEPNTALRPRRITLLSWNIKKGSRQGWDSDLRRLANDKDLVLLQEAHLNRSYYGALGGSMYHSGAQGWKTSGVLTVARAGPINLCSYQHKEPILGTPKASLLTVYRLAGTENTLLVVNVHAVNFAVGLSEFRNQVRDLYEVIGRHDGPVIFSGDFNTWRSSRLKILRSLNAEHGLHPIRFADDKRTRMFGHALDHIFVRGLRALSAHVKPVDSSDHNPLITTLGTVESIAVRADTDPNRAGT